VIPKHVPLDKCQLDVYLLNYDRCGYNYVRDRDRIEQLPDSELHRVEAECREQAVAKWRSYMYSGFTFYVRFLEGIREIKTSRHGQDHSGP
jgi:hypothetical protein